MLWDCGNFELGYLLDKWRLTIEANDHRLGPGDSPNVSRLVKLKRNTGLCKIVGIDVP